MADPKTWPRLTTGRLVLRPFSLEDAKEVQRLAGDRDVAATTNVPHPYEDGVAEKWIGGHEDAFQQGSRMVFAITLRSGELVGAMGLSLDEKNRRGELGATGSARPSGTTATAPRPCGRWCGTASRSMA